VAMLPLRSSSYPAAGFSTTDHATNPNTRPNE